MGPAEGRGGVGAVAPGRLAFSPGSCGWERALPVVRHPVGPAESPTGRARGTEPLLAEAAAQPHCGQLPALPWGRPRRDFGVRTRGRSRPVAATVSQAL